MPKRGNCGSVLRVDASRTIARRSIHQPSVASLNAPAEMPHCTFLGSPGMKSCTSPLARLAFTIESGRHAILIALVAYRVPHSSRLRALALFGRRPVECGPSRCCQCPKTSTQAEMISPSFLNAFVAATAPRVRGWYHKRAAERSGAPGRARSKE